MGYSEDIRNVAFAHRVELRGDLDLARAALRRSREEGDGLERQVTSLEALIRLIDDEDFRVEASGMTLHEAMVSVLGESPQGMLRASDLAREINRQSLYKMRDGRPVEPQQVHARVGHYSHLFVREGTFIKLASR